MGALIGIFKRLSNKLINFLVFFILKLSGNSFLGYLILHINKYMIYLKL